MSNRLQNEKSPYLLQHSDNPVDWYPWSDNAFEKARKEDKPIFLSIGYATCHWCHVMAHESFEDDEIARLMNDAFVNIKVDREERPDIDNTYMTICQLLTGQGGWPLTVIMTPDKEPFFAATYIPKESRFNRMGMKELIPQIKKAWLNERDKVIQSSKKIVDGFSKTLDIGGNSSPDLKWIHSASDEFKNKYDTQHGGFGSKPKFPAPHNLTFLMQYSSSFNDDESLHMALKTLEQMRLGGIYDHIGFGFHRYSTDNRWLLPHFEKMLYDQATLVIAYTEGWILTGDPIFKQTVFEIAKYVKEELTSPEGGFYSAEDADSEGEEGKFYIWDVEEIESLTDPEQAAFTSEIFNLEPGGNFEDEATGRKTGANIPYLKERPEKLAAKKQLTEQRFKKKLEAVRKKLKAEREKRIRPALDDKILTDWNGLMIAALARAGAVFENPEMVAAAKSSWDFISDLLLDEDGELMHRYRKGEAGIQGMADDYAFLIWGLIELWQATFNTLYLEQALMLNHIMLDKFSDEENGGIYFTSHSAEYLLGRQKNIYDGALPSSNSVAAMNLLRLSRLTGQTELEQQSENIYRTFSGFLEKAPESASHAMEALIRVFKPSLEIVICGKKDNPTTRKMIQTVQKESTIPYVLLLKTEENSDHLARLAPYTGPFSLDDTPAAYICRKFSCEQPVYSVDELKLSLKK